MKLRGSLFLIGAVVFALLLNAYLFLHELFAKLKASPLAGGSASQDRNAKVSSLDNPNKTLFISCGGYLE